MGKVSDGILRRAQEAMWNIDCMYGRNDRMRDQWMNTSKHASMHAPIESW